MLKQKEDQPVPVAEDVAKEEAVELHLILKTIIRWLDPSLICYQVLKKVAGRGLVQMFCARNTTLERAQGETHT